MVAAFLMARYDLPPYTALERIRQARPLAYPNEGFYEQLEYYEAMGNQYTPESELGERALAKFTLRAERKHFPATAL